MGKDRKGIQGNSTTKKQLQAKVNALEAQNVEITACIASAAAAAPLPPTVTIPLPTAPSVSSAIGAPLAPPANPYHATAQAVQGILKRKRE